MWGEALRVDIKPPLPIVGVVTILVSPTKAVLFGYIIKKIRTKVSGESAASL